jgi:RNA polymerase sigma-70 factor (ECF subfamily)
MPEAAEVRALLALLLLQDSRREARSGPACDLVLLEDQDRARWDAEEIAEGRALVDAAFRGLPAGALPGPYLVQAAIAACHVRSRTGADTPWAEIAALYGVLAVVAPGPVVELNRAVAVAMADGPGAGFVLVEALGADGALAEYHLFHATRADLLRRLGRRRESAAAYGRALDLVTNDAERAFLARRLPRQAPRADATTGARAAPPGSAPQQEKVPRPPCRPPGGR